VTADGVELGLLRDVQLRRIVPGGRPELHAEEFGVERIDSVYVSAVYRLGMALRGSDPAALAKIFPNVVAGAVVWPGAKPPGHFRSADAVALVFTPTDPAHPSVSMGTAIPEVAEDLTVNLGRRTEYLILVSFLATREGGLTWG
jgi:hypothetical protein